MPESEPNADEAEFYATPAWCVHRLREVVYLGAKRIDPCVGEGAIPDAVGGDWHVCDIRRTDYLMAHQDRGMVADYLRTNVGQFHLCVMNPPFSKAMEFAQKALSHCAVVCMLQRLCWLASGERADWLRKYPPGVYVLPNRPSFTGDGRTDGQDYAWFVWGDGDPLVRILASTPAAVRKADAVPLRNRAQVEMWPEAEPGRSRFVRADR